MPYWQIFYHFVWATRNREALITPDVESMIYELIHDKATDLKTTVHALNGMAEHVHLVASVPPGLAPATFVGQIKGFTSTMFNKASVRELPFSWQAEYGVFTFDQKRLHNVADYVINQKTHHANGNVIPLLERVEEYPGRTIHEAPASYMIDDTEWWREMLELDIGVG